MSSENSSMVCEICGARATNLRRGRCWICYVRWAESRPVGFGAACAICNDRRRENLRLVEFQGAWNSMCHNCGSKALKLRPMPKSLEGVKQRLSRDRRWSDRRDELEDDLLLNKERRVGERRALPDAPGMEWMDADDLIIEIIEMPDAEDLPVEATTIAMAQFEV